MLGVACRYRKSEHRIIQPRILSWIKRQIPDARLRDSLFIYYHLQHGTFVIAQWVVPERSFIDIHNLGNSLANFTADAAQRFRQQIKSPVGRHELGKALRQKERDRLTQEQDINDDKVERRNRRMSSKIVVSMA